VWASDHDLRMVATDSYRLSVKTTRLDTAVPTPIEANVPARALAELVRIVQQTEAPTIAIERSDNQIVFTVERATLSSRLIDGQFPNYQLLLPESADHELRVDREELAEVVRRVSLLAQKNAPLRLTFAEGELTVSAQTPDVGEASEALPVPFKGEPFEIGFNPDFLRDGLESVESDELVLKLISSLRPGLIESPEPGEFIYLIMPIRLNV
jgi:DNA polymerase III subunit beta